MSCVYRFRQFWRACFARLSLADHLFVCRYLSRSEQALFYGMALYDQRHCVDVAVTAARVGRARAVAASHLPLLIRAGLLHDVGKLAGDIGRWDRSVITVLQAVNSGVVRSLAERKLRIGAGFCRACRVQLHHAERGARMLQRVGVEDLLVELVRSHHEPAVQSSPLLQELAGILQYADNMN